MKIFSQLLACEKANGEVFKTKKHDEAGSNRPKKEEFVQAKSRLYGVRRYKRSPSKENSVSGVDCSTKHKTFKTRDGLPSGFSKQVRNQHAECAEDGAS